MKPGRSGELPAATLRDWVEPKMVSHGDRMTQNDIAESWCCKMLQVPQIYNLQGHDNDEDCEERDDQHWPALYKVWQGMAKDGQEYATKCNKTIQHNEYHWTKS